MTGLFMLPVLAIGFGAGILAVAVVAALWRALGNQPGASHGLPAVDVARAGWRIAYWPGVVTLGSLVIAHELLAGAASFPWDAALDRIATDVSIAAGAAAATAAFIARRNARPATHTTEATP